MRTNYVATIMIFEKYLKLVKNKKGKILKN